MGSSYFKLPKAMEIWTLWPSWLKCLCLCMCQHLYKCNLYASTSCCYRGPSSFWELFYISWHKFTKKSYKCTPYPDLEISIYKHFEGIMTKGSWLRRRKIRLCSAMGRSGEFEKFHDEYVSNSLTQSLNDDNDNDYSFLTPNINS